MGGHKAKPESVSEIIKTIRGEKPDEPYNLLFEDLHRLWLYFQLIGKIDSIFEIKYPEIPTFEQVLEDLAVLHRCQLRLSVPTVTSPKLGGLGILCNPTQAELINSMYGIVVPSASLVSNVLVTPYTHIENVQPFPIKHTLKLGLSVSAPFVVSKDLGSQLEINNQGPLTIASIGYDYTKLDLQGVVF